MKEKMPDVGEYGSEDMPSDGIWGMLTDEQRKYFKKLTEKSEENLKYIG